MKHDTRTIARSFLGFAADIKKIIKKVFHNSEYSTMTEQQFRTLLHLKESGKAGLKDLSSRMMVSSPSLCIMMNRLHDQGLITRETDENDRRNTLYSLSEEGDKCLDVELEGKIDFLSKYIDRLGNADKERLLQCINEVRDILGKVLIDDSSI